MKRCDRTGRLARSQVLLERADAALRESSVLLAKAHSLLEQPIDGKADGVAEETTPAVGQDPNMW